MKIITDGVKVPIKSWCNNPEDSAIEQAKNLANLPFIFKHVALMPDTHCGFGMPIGGVIACDNVVIPNAVGVDIGCGMAAVKTSLTEITTERLKEIMTLIRKRVPVGRNHHSESQMSVEELFGDFPFKNYDTIVSEQSYSATKQVGTLGDGNHFIEIQRGSDGHIWFMIHTGSRNLGYRVAKYYNNLAQELCKKWHSNIPSIKGEDGLAFLPLDTQEAQQYLTEMNLCMIFAQKNRELILERIKESFNQIPCENCNANGGIKGSKCNLCSGTGIDQYCDMTKSPVLFLEEINIHHNYAQMENHFGKNVMVHRKGATSAKEGQMGIIPGSQGTNSYIVRGKGNADSFSSCSHGAGRKLSRTKAKELLDLEQEQRILNEQGIVHSIRNKNDLEEASSSYKDITIVMEEQKDLVEIVVELKPLGVIKG